MRYDAIISTGTLEKVMLVGLVAVIFSQMLPDFTGSTTDVFIGVAAVVVVNSGITLAAARRRWTIRSTALAFAARLAMNVGLVLVADPLLGRHNARLDGYDTMFFLMLISLITTLHDRWRPVHEVREVLARGEPAPRAGGRARLTPAVGAPIVGSDRRAESGPPALSATNPTAAYSPRAGPFVSRVHGRLGGTGAMAASAGDSGAPSARRPTPGALDGPDARTPSRHVPHDRRPPARRHVGHGRVSAR